MRSIYLIYVSLLSELQSMVGFDIISSLFTAVSGLATQEDHHTSGSHLAFFDSIASESDITPYGRDPGVLNEQSLVSLLGESMATNIIRDPRNFGIIFDPKQRRFIKRNADGQGTANSDVQSHDMSV